MKLCGVETDLLSLSVSFCVCCVAHGDGDFSPDTLMQSDSDRFSVLVCSCAHTVCDRPAKLTCGEQRNRVDFLMYLLSFMAFSSTA